VATIEFVLIFVEVDFSQVSYVFTVRLLVFFYSCAICYAGDGFVMSVSVTDVYFCSVLLMGIAVISQVYGTEEKFAVDLLK